MADTNQSPPKPNDDVLFDGNVLDLDRVIGYAAIQHLLYPGAFPSDDLKVAFLFAHFRGGALDWAAAQALKDPRPAFMGSYSQTLTAVRNQFGYDGAQVQAIAATRINALRQSGDLLEFLTEFHNLTEQAGLRSDVTRLTLLIPKLRPEYHDALVRSGEILSSYTSTRTMLLNMYSRAPVQKQGPEDRRGQARCKRCGKRGHTGTQCRSKN